MLFARQSQEVLAGLHAIFVTLLRIRSRIVGDPHALVKVPSLSRGEWTGWKLTLALGADYLENDNGCVRLSFPVSSTPLDPWAPLAWWAYGFVAP